MFNVISQCIYRHRDFEVSVLDLELSCIWRFVNLTFAFQLWLWDYRQLDLAWSNRLKTFWTRVISQRYTAWWRLFVHPIQFILAILNSLSNSMNSFLFLSMLDTWGVSNAIGIYGNNPWMHRSIAFQYIQQWHKEPFINSSWSCGGRGLKPLFGFAFFGVF